MIHMSKLVTAVKSADNVADLVNNIVENRGYTYGDLTVTVKQPATPSTYAFPTGAPYHLGFNQAMDDWPVYLLTGHYTIDGVAKTYLVFTIGYNTTVYDALSTTITVAANDPLIGTGTERTIAKGMALAELLGYDDYMVLYHTASVGPLSAPDVLTAEFPGLLWNNVAGQPPLDPPVIGPRYVFILDAIITSDNTDLLNPHLYRPTGDGWTVPDAGPFYMGFKDQSSSGTLTERIWIVPAQQYTTDTENMTDLAMYRVSSTKADVDAIDIATDGRLDDAEVAILALKDAFEQTAVYGTKVETVVDQAIAVREATQYIPRP